MSTQTSDNNKRIAKNTLLLYFRMLFMMAVSLFTSRVVLNTLGVEDYGIYNVVGGIVAMFGFINGSMSSATQRYITFALGKGDKNRLQTVFSTTLQIHTLIAGVIVLLGETIGLWFLYNKMQIPADRMDAAFWVLQCSIIAAVVMIISVPYNADIVAHEKMSAFAYISILEVVLKLAIVYMLLVFSFDKLVLYAFLLLAIQILIRFCYSYYCNKHFEETKYKHVWDKALFKEMTGFAGWSMFGNLAAVLFGQGLNMLLNVFFGPVVNAARGIAVQVQNAVQQFVLNFQMALNPQITKTYAQGEMQEMHKLMYRSARFSFFLLFFLSLPVLFETKFILTVWLKIVPDNTVVFLRIMLCTSLIYTLSNPLIIANQATGKVRKYQAECKCKNGVNHSDLTIGDYWAARVTDQDFDDDKGVGLVLVNTSKGKEYFDRLNMTVRKSDLDKANLCNGGFNEHTHVHPKRALFFALIYQGKTIKDAVDICLKISLSSRVKNKTKRLVKGVVKQVLGDKGIKVVKTAFGK